MNFNVVKGSTSNEIERWSIAYVEPDNVEYLDGLNYFTAVKAGGCEHIQCVTGGGAGCVGKPELIYLKILIVNVKFSLVGSCYAINHKHFPHYLVEFCYRFNRCFNLRDMMSRFLFATMETHLCRRGF